jgi:hypothetical protein
LKPPVTKQAEGYLPARERMMDISIGEVLYLVLVIAVAWWAYDTLKEYL